MEENGKEVGNVDDLIDAAMKKKAKDGKIRVDDSKELKQKSEETNEEGKETKPKGEKKQEGKAKSVEDAFEAAINDELETDPFF